MKSNRILTALGLLVVAGFCGGVFLLIFVPVELYQLAAARTWPARTGTITTARLRHYRTKDGDAWQAELRGTYDDT